MKKTKLLTGATVLAFTLGAGGLALTNSLQAQAESTTKTTKSQLADVAKIDAESGERVYVDAQSQVIKSLGEAGKLTVDGQKKPSFEITVHSVKVLDSCTLRGFGDKIKPENGRFLLVDISASLAASAAKAVDEEIALMPLDASTFGVSAGENRKPNYQLDTVASYSCEVDNAIDIAVGAGDEVRGMLMLDAPYSSGQIVYDPEKTGGWTWGY
ncbi:hypothetical protein [Arthrobacter sp. MYb213]|uniref:hypothetical protein n=1 Tax=Arthrobacter sp. MYb213 TaxID=1848595 RepID=UPI000CFBDECC|nr:hypothetical protein [Arthrobacter sp. MYb213]PRB72676.1 hypothetical protein CQ011_03285 [Arthrobacter sp. MYb213]